MLAHDRQKQILEILSKSQSVEIDTLTSRLEVSEMTIRRDLQKLAQAGLLTRTRGGAVNTPFQYFPQPTFDEKETVHQKEKRAIGAAAARLINANDTIGLGSGTTCFQLAKSLNPSMELTVVTNAVNIALELNKRRNIQLILTGGALIQGSYSLVGPVAEDAIQKIRLNKLFLGATGISMENGVTTQNLLEASLYKAMIRVCEEVIILADHSKFDLITLAPIIELCKVKRLITDSMAAPEELDKVIHCGVEVLVATSGGEGG